MSEVVIKVENLSKHYRLGLVGRSTLSDDLNRFWAKLRGKPDPLLKVDQLPSFNLQPSTFNLQPPTFTDSSTPEKPNKPNELNKQNKLSTPNGHIWALKDINFEVKRGEILGIIGSNGAGKSTLLKILSRVTAATFGECRVKGRIASLLEVGTGFHPELTGRENIFLNGAILGMTKGEIKQRFDEIVDFAEIEKFIDTPVKRYSSGMYVRLAFAVAAHLEPEILIVDEVLAVGDAQFQKKCLGKMEEVEGRTVLFVSHNMAAINRICQRVLWLDKGQTRDIGGSDAICQRYLFDNQKMSGTHEFKSEKDYTIEFLKAEIIDSQGKTASILRADEEIRFRIIYRVKSDVSGSTVGLNICTAEAQSLWATSDIDIFPDLYEMRKKGLWVYECTAPAQILRPGRYLVALGSAGTHGQFFHHPELFAFEITTQGYWRESHKYFGLGGGPISAPMRIERPIAVVGKKVAGVNV